MEYFKRIMRLFLIFSRTEIVRENAERIEGEKKKSSQRSVKDTVFPSPVTGRHQKSKTRRSKSPLFFRAGDQEYGPAGLPLLLVEI